MRHLSDANVSNLKAEVSAKRPERQRGDWSFLTWAFFLPHLLATEVFFGKGAKAADQDGSPHGGLASDLATNMVQSSDSPLNPVLAKQPDDLDAGQRDGSASSNSQTVLSDLKLDTQQSGPSGLSPVSNEQQKTASEGGGGGGSFDGYALTTDGAVSARSGEANLDSNIIHAAITSDQSGENPLPPSIINGSGETPEGPRNGLHPTGSPESEGPHGLGPSPVSSLTTPGHGFGFLGDSDAGHATSVHLTDSTTTPAPDITPGLGAMIDVKGVLGFDVQLNGDGLSLSAELDTGPLSDLLGFDLRVTADGIFAGLNSGAPLLTPIVNSIAGEVESVLHATSSELDSILSLDGQLGSALLPGLLGSNSGLSIAVGDSQSQPVKALLAEVTGVQVLGGLESSQLVSKIVDAVGAPGQNEASQAVALPTHIMSEALQVAGLNETGAISSGDAFHFAADTLQQTDALFAGQQYTDYNVTLQSNNAVGARIGGLVSEVGSQAAETVSSIMHPAESAMPKSPTDNHQEAAQHDEQLNASSLLHTTLSVVHLTSH